MQIDTLIREYVDENLIFGNTVAYSNDTSFTATGILDSMGILELVSWVDKTFALCTDFSEVTPENFDSVTRLTTFIQAKMHTPGQTTHSKSNAAAL